MKKIPTIQLTPAEAAKRLIELNKTILGQTFPQIRSADEEVIIEDEGFWNSDEDRWGDEEEKGEL